MYDLNTRTIRSKIPQLFNQTIEELSFPVSLCTRRTRNYKKKSNPIRNANQTIHEILLFLLILCVLEGFAKGALEANEIYKYLQTKIVRC